MDVGKDAYPLALFIRTDCCCMCASCGGLKDELPLNAGEGSETAEGARIRPGDGDRYIAPGPM
jgi:hypothetical protein